MSNICKHIANEFMNEMAIGKEEYIYTNDSMQYAYYEDGSLVTQYRKFFRKNLKIFSNQIYPTCYILNNEKNYLTLH